MNFRLILSLTLIALFATGFPAEAQQGVRLDDVLRSTDDHPRIRFSRAEVDVQHGQKLMALSPPSPRLTFREEEIATGGSLGSGGLREWQLSQGFDIPLLIGARSWGYGMREERAEMNLSFARAEVRASIIRGYVRWYAAWHKRELQRQSTALAKTFAEKARLRTEAGESSALEAARANAEAARMAMALADADAEVTAAAGALRIAVGRGNAMDGLEAMYPADSLQPLKDLLPADRLDSIPVPYQVQLAMLDARAAKKDASWRWMQLLPDFEIAAFRQDFSDIGEHWGLELSASIPLWFLLDTRGSVEAAQAEARKAEAEYDEARLSWLSVRAVREQRYQNAWQKWTSFESGLALEADRLLRSAVLGYDSGEISYMEYIDAVQEANSIRTAYFDLLAELYDAAADLEPGYGNILRIQ
jgi:outer membrane protein TolC